MSSFSIMNIEKLYATDVIGENLTETTESIPNINDVMFVGNSFLLFVVVLIMIIIIYERRNYLLASKEKNEKRKHNAKLIMKFSIFILIIIILLYISLWQGNQYSFTGR